MQIQASVRVEPVEVLAPRSVTSWSLSSSRVTPLAPNLGPVAKNSRHNEWTNILFSTTHELTCL